MILRSTSATISVTLSVDGENTDPTPDAATVTVYREDGSVLVATTAATGGTDGLFSYVLTPTDTAQVDVLRAVWKMTLGGLEQTLTTFHPIAGGFLCSLADISAAITAAGGTPPDVATLMALRDGVGQRLEDACNVAFRPSYKRDTFCGDGSRELLLSKPRPLTVLSASVGDTDLDTDDLTIFPGGTLRHTWNWSCDELVTVIYEHGWEVTPDPIRRAAIKLATTYFEAADDRINRFREDDQEFWLSVAGGSRDTGIPEVDRAIQDYRYPVIG